MEWWQQVWVQQQVGLHMWRKKDWFIEVFLHLTWIDWPHSFKHELK